MQKVTPVKLVYATNEDYLKNIVTMIKIENNREVVHRRFLAEKIIEGNDLIISESVVS